MSDFIAHLTRQIVFSRATFGPTPRTEGVLDHMTKEIEEVRKAASHDERTKEWVDLVILALDGLTRELWYGDYANVGGLSRYDDHFTSTEIADLAVYVIKAKQAKNERRDWPDWRTADPDKAIEHVRTA